MIISETSTAISKVLKDHLMVHKTYSDANQMCSCSGNGGLGAENELGVECPDGKK